MFIKLGKIAELLTPKLGEDVSYAVTDQSNRDLFLANQSYRSFDHGKGVAGYRIFTNAALCQGRYFICLGNDNFMQGIDADVKVSAIVKTTYYENTTVTEPVVTPRYEKQLKKEPVVKTMSVPVAGR